MCIRDSAKCFYTKIIFRLLKIFGGARAPPGPMGMTPLALSGVINDDDDADDDADSCLPADDVEHMSYVVASAKSVVEVNDDERSRQLGVAAQGDAVTPRHERAGFVADLVIAAQ